MRRGESFHGTIGGGRFRLELVRTCPCLSAPMGHPAFVELTRSKKKRKKERKRKEKRKSENERERRRKNNKKKVKVSVGNQDKREKNRERGRGKLGAWQTGRTRRTIIIYRS